MRKSCGTLCLLLLFSCAFAQHAIGLKGGLNSANTKLKGASYSSRLGFHAGLLAQLPLGKTWLLRPEILYTVKGYKFSSTPFNSSGTVQLDYICLPLLAGYRITPVVTLLAGPEVGYLAKANTHFDARDHNSKDNFANVDLGFDVGGSCNFSKKFGADLRYNYGFAGLRKTKVYTDNQGNVIGMSTVKNGSNRVFQAGVFYLFSK